MNTASRQAWLVRKVARGASLETWTRWRGLGFQGMLQSWFADTGAEEPSPPPMPPVGPGITPTVLLLGVTVRWFLERLLSDLPVRNYLTMFWHRRLVVSAPRVFSPALLSSQVGALRELSTGRYGDLLAGLFREGATQMALGMHGPDRDQEAARILLEEYTVGPGVYSCSDLQALSRALESWRLSLPTLRPRTDIPPLPMRLLGQTGQQEVPDWLARLALHPATARRTVVALWTETTGGAPPEAAVRDLMALWQSSHGHVATVLRAMVERDDFYADLRPQLMSPVDFLISQARRLGQTGLALAHLQALNRLGECPYLPPSPAGWQAGPETWLHPNALLGRWRLVADWVDGSQPLVQQLSAFPESARVAALETWLAPWSLSSATRAELQAHAREPAALLRLALCAPELQLI